MQWKAPYLATVLLMVSVTASAQSPTGSFGSLSQPPDLHYTVRTTNGRTQFHLGEPIEIEELYSSSAPGKYVLLSSPAKIKDGHDTELTFQPSEGVVDRFHDDGGLSANPILDANCSGGFGSGFAGDCFHCDREYVLGVSPIRFARVMNYQFQITSPGLYRITASTASVVPASQPDAERSAIPMRSTLDIEVVDDPAWSHTQVSETVAAFQQAQSDLRAHRWDLLKPWETLGEPSASLAYQELRSRLAKAADNLRFLDSEESLIEIVRLYNGSDTLYGYSNSFYSGIVQSRHPALAAELLETRMLEPDFRVSERLLDQLLAMKLRVRFPSGFNSPASNASLYPAARKILHDYILELGESLPGKESEALTVSAATFRAYAAKDFCTLEPLIPGRVAARMLKAAGQPVQH
jgi:hypothetical protein